MLESDLETFTVGDWHHLHDVGSTGLGQLLVKTCNLRISFLFLHTHLTQSLIPLHEDATKLFNLTLQIIDFFDLVTELGDFMLQAGVFPVDGIDTLCKSIDLLSLFGVLLGFVTTNLLVMSSQWRR